MTNPPERLPAVTTTQPPMAAPAADAPASSAAPADPAVATPGTSPASLAQSTSPHLYPRWLRRLLAWWWGLAAFVALALAGNIIVVPLAQNPSQWTQGVAAQIAELIALARMYPIPTSLAVLVIGALTYFGWREHLAQKREEDEAHRTATIQLVEQGVAACCWRWTTSRPG